MINVAAYFNVFRESQSLMKQMPTLKGAAAIEKRIPKGAWNPTKPSLKKLPQRSLEIVWFMQIKGFQGNSNGSTSFVCPLNVPPWPTRRTGEWLFRDALERIP